MLPALVLAILTVLLVGGLASVIGWRRLPSFDGAMNLQVARYLADYGSYGRYYGGFELFPSEVQTNGIPVLMAALSIKIWGISELALQVPNIFFVTFLGALFALLAWPNRLLMVVAPLVLLGVPTIWQFGLSGYGEVPTFVFQLAALLVLARGLSSADRTRQQKYQLLAFLLAGAAVVTKTVAVSVLPALAVMVMVQRVARRKTNWFLDFASVGTLLLPIAVFELFRLVQFGSLDSYLSYWDYAVERIGYQSGLAAGDDTTSLWSSINERTQTLGGMFGLGRIFALAFVATPLGVAVWVSLRTLSRLRNRPHPQHYLNLALMGLAVFVGGYFVWWLFITPLEKAWPRRILIAVLAIYAMYILLLRYMGGLDKARRAGVAAVLVLLTLGVVPRVGHAVDVSRHWSSALPEFTAATDFVDSVPGQVHFYGYHWWSAPQYGLYAQRKIDDLSVVPTCELLGQKAYVVWDWYAASILSAEPPNRDSQLVYELVAEFERTADVYRVRPADGACSVGEG